MPNDESNHNVQQLVTKLAQALVDEPEAVEVQTATEVENTVLRLRVAPGDVGKIIGKQGRTIRSLRIILGVIGIKTNHHYTLDILEEDGNGDRL